MYNSTIYSIINFYLYTTIFIIFRSNFDANPPPILIDNGMAVLENEKIERHIMKNIPGGYNLFVQDKEVATLIENLYSVRVTIYLVLSYYSLIHCVTAKH